MANEELPTEYDAIILGTGMTECLVAAALSRIGYKVLHLDRNDYYSGDWACFHFEAIQNWIAQQQGKLSEEGLTENSEVNPERALQEGEKLLQLEVQNNAISNVADACYARCKPVTPDSKPENLKTKAQTDESLNHGQSAEPPSLQTDSAETQPPDLKDDSNTQSQPAESSGQTAELPPSELLDATNIEAPPADGAGVKKVNEESGKSEELTGKKEWTFQDLQSKWRKFNIDLMPKILYCRGAMVELLISSDVAKYCEFRTITRVLTHIKGELQQVPCSRSDVFGSKQVSMIEKRMLMKFLTFCMEFEKHPQEYEGYEDKPFIEFLNSKKLSANVRHYVQHAISMAGEGTSTAEGLKSTQKFLQSLGRYGNTAFLWPLYGSGELPQAFCRMCAVFGGVYCLRRTALGAIVDTDNKCQGIVDTTGQRLSSKWLVMEASYASSNLLTTSLNTRRISRAILVTDGSLSPDNQLHMSLLNLPASPDQPQPITLLELSGLSMTCPDDLYLVHLTCISTRDAKDDLHSTVTRLFHCAPREEKAADDSRPNVLWSVYFNVADTTGAQMTSDSPDNVFLLSGPNTDLDFDQAITQAREVFEKICPGEDFLPRAPNPEDIIYDDGEGNQQKESGFEPSGEQQQPSGEENTIKEATGEGEEDVKEATGEGEQAIKEATGEGDQVVKEATGGGEQAVKEATGEGEQAIKEATGEGDQVVKEATGGGEQAVKEATGEGEQAVKEVTGEGEQAVKKATGEREQAVKEATGEGEQAVKEATGEGEPAVKEATGERESDKNKVTEKES